MAAPEGEGVGGPAKGLLSQGAMRRPLAPCGRRDPHPMMTASSGGGTPSPSPRARPSSPPPPPPAPPAPRPPAADREVLALAGRGPGDGPRAWRLNLEAHRRSLVHGFNVLLARPTLRAGARYEHQERT